MLKASGARRVVDLGCGSGKLLKRLLAEKQFTEILGVDVGIQDLEIAARRLRLDTLSERQRARIRIVQGALTYRDTRIEGFDAAALVEVIEHIDPDRLGSVERVVFEFARPGLVVVTTPNREYNAKFEGMQPGQLRHPDHRFEWTRAEFQRLGGGRRRQVRLHRADRADRRGGRGAGRAVADGDLRAGCGVRIAIPDFCLVVLIGASGSGKSTFARRHFKPTEVISSDACRGMVEDDENSLDATGDAFALLHFIAETRLKRRKLVVVDATNVRQEDRAQLVRIAKKHHALAVAIVLNPGEDICHERNKARPDRQYGPHVVRNHMASLRRNIRRIDKEGFRYVHELRSVDEIDSVEIVRERLWTDARHVEGPFDIIGDVHGCADELEALLDQAGLPRLLAEARRRGRECTVIPPPGTPRDLRRRPRRPRTEDARRAEARPRAW